MASAANKKVARDSISQVSYLKQKASALEKGNQWKSIAIMLKRRPGKMKDVIDLLVDLGVEKPTARDITNFGKRGKHRNKELEGEETVQYAAGKTESQRQSTGECCPFKGGYPIPHPSLQ